MELINDLTGETIEMKIQIQSRKEKLVEVSNKLKNDFIGLDDCIDKIISSIAAWYSMPEILTRPTIVNLFGLTGVGKTDLVRKLVNYLEMTDNFVEIQMANSSGSSHEKKIQSVLASSNISTDAPGILLLDEIQRFRTVDDQGHEIHDYHFSDIWMLLSDGNFGNNSQLKNDLLEMIYENYYYDQFRETENDNNPTTTKSKKNSPQQPKKKEYKFKQSYHSAKRLKNMLKLNESIDEVMTWDTHKKIEVVFEKMEDKTAYQDEVYSKLLIFISGNLDEAYTMADETSQVEIDADYFHERSKQISFLTIKDKLLHRFKPESIARFGNCYVIYPSLSKKSYQKIIQRKVNDVVNKIYNNCGVMISVDQSVYDAIYRNGVFPTQGTRPVFSTITTFFESSLPHFILNALINNINNFHIYYEGKYLKSEICGEKIELLAEGDVDKTINRKKNLDETYKIAVHESGHAVAYALLFGISPTQISINNASDEMKGFIMSHPISGSLNQYRQSIQVNVAGRIAEEIIFGENNVCSGNTSDLANATSIASRMVRQWAMSSLSSKISNPTVGNCDLFNNNISASNPLIDEIIIEETKNCRTLLKNNKKLIVMASKYLVEYDKMSPDKFIEICKEYGLDILNLEEGETIHPNYKEMFEMFEF